MASPGLLQPLSILELVFANVSMDFIEGLPRLEGKDTIMVIMNRLTKYAHLVGLTHPYQASRIAQAYTDNVLKLHRVLDSIVSGQNLVFLSTFWKELF